ncbi:Glycosyltransferases OS=Pelotomaculum thermopropionicum (strain DSM 13744 / JCM 10971 / SI) GN=WcaA PE=4 SV=1: Glycos_transf_2 [Gemmata massiliana]|uniref:Glycosyltransferase 2-like domain-containing protein n=1 Tax=Gemmata massiliana TaxID=1210884 RepID=A0A6P2D9C7_9BACT|nr:glycosyltransferase family 2 protein [Gemmata massiliana]VTR96965.1 Glycosyltransferases OS=Pelotomaculum thermopropionicum (strain DSM 13744 / JCM 10971 / SI) GN=WcaA PE=4 SV=1: Glycos_transf_2 [Gemmata massiliana]
MAKPTTPHDGVTVVIPVHNAAAQLEKMLPAWGLVLGKQNRPYQIIVVNDGSTDGTAAALEKLAPRVPHLQVLTHDARRGFGACLRTALAETTQPLFMYAGIDNQYTPNDIRSMLERIELRDEIFGKQPDLISGFRAGQPRPALVKGSSFLWKLFWRVFAGLPIVDSPPWYGWGQWWYKNRASWVFGVPLADVNSEFKLYRTAFLKRVPIQSDGDFVHVELVAKATFLTSIMDEVPLTPKTEPFPPLASVSADRSKVFSDPKFAFNTPAEVKPPEAGNAPTAPDVPATEVNAGGLGSSGSPVPAS